MSKGLPYFMSEKEEAILTVIPGCEGWHCQEPRARWGCGRESEARKIHFSFQGGWREN
jgi:hypothetical protein